MNHKSCRDIKIISKIANLIQVGFLKVNCSKMASVPILSLILYFPALVPVRRHILVFKYCNNTSSLQNIFHSVFVEIKRSLKIKNYHRRCMLFCIYPTCRQGFFGIHRYVPILRRIRFHSCNLKEFGSLEFFIMFILWNFVLRRHNCGNKERLRN